MRGLKGNAWIFEKPAKPQASQVAWNSSSVSPGKPTMMSVVNAGLGSPVANPGELLQKAFHGIAPPHAPQHGVRAALQRRMKMGAEMLAVRGGGDEVLDSLPRLQCWKAACATAGDAIQLPGRDATAGTAPVPDLPRVVSTPKCPT